VVVKYKVVVIDEYYYQLKLFYFLFLLHSVCVMCRTVRNIFLQVINSYVLLCSYVDRTIFLLMILYSTYNRGPKFQNAIAKKIADYY
jgi:hypothetical protein